MLERFPLTPNGKVDRKALPAPETARGAQGYVAPRNATEDILAGLWATLLKQDKVGIHDNFFDLGGHSLLATQLVSKLRAVFSAEVPLRTLFEAPSIAALAQRIEQARTRDLAPAMVPVGRDGALPLSYAQQRLWFLDQFEPGQAAYNIPAALVLKGTLDSVALAATFNDIVRRHEALRTTFALRDGNPVQVIAPVLALALPLTDLGALAPAERHAQAQWLIQDEAQTVFDLTLGPLMRTRLIKLADDEHVLLLTLHHIVADGWSMSVLINEIGLGYAAHRDGQAAALPTLAIQYADYAHWQRAWLSGAVLDEQLAYWQTQLSGAPTLLALPTDRPRPVVQSHRGARHGFSLDAHATAGLHALGRQAQATLFMSLAAVFNIVLARYAQQSDICLGTVIANRNRAEIEGLIGFFVNTLVLRTRIDGRCALRHAAATSQE